MEVSRATVSTYPEPSVLFRRCMEGKTYLPHAGERNPAPVTTCS